MSDGPLLRGTLSIRKKKGFEARFFLLYEEHLDYFASEADAGSGAPPRGRLELADVERVEWEEGRLLIHSKDSPVIVLQTHTNGDAWFHEISRLTGQFNLEVGGMQKATESQGSRQAKERIQQRDRGLSLELEGAAALWQGQLELEHKGEAKRRFFVLLDDALVYYLQESDWNAGKDPRGAFLLAEVLALEDSQAEPSFALRMKGQTRPFRLRAASEADLDMWLRLLRAALEHKLGEAFKLHRVLDQQEEEAVEAAPPDSREEEAWLQRVSHEHRLQKRKRAADLSAGWSCKGCSASSRDGAAMAYGCVEGCDFHLCKECHGKAASLRQPAARPGALQEEAAEEAAPAEPLFEGYLEQRKGSRQEEKYFVLGEESFDYFSSQQDCRQKARPRGSILLGDILGMEVSEQGSLVVELSDRRFELRTVGEHSREEAEAWSKAWQRALAKRAQEAPIARPPEAPIARPPEASSPSRSRRLLQSTVGISRRGQLEPRRAVLFTDRLEFYMNDAAAASGEEPRTRVALADVQHFETRDGGWMMLEISERVVEFHMEQSSLEWEAWRTALVELLGHEVAGSAAAAPSVAVEAVVEAIDNMLKSRHIRARDLIQDPRYNPSKGQHLDAHGLQQVCAEAGLSVSLADCISLLGSLATGGRQELDLGQLEGVLRSHRRVRTPEDAEREAMRARASLKILKKSAQVGAEERLHQARADDAVEKARVRFRAATFGCGGVNWSKVFSHYDPTRAGFVDARGFIALVRREVKISAREMPDAMLEKVFTLVDKAGSGSIGNSQFLAWLGLQDEADRALREERAAVRIQSLQRGREARARVSAMKEGCPKKLRQGTFKLQGSDGRIETRVLCVFEDRLEFVGPAHGHRILAGDVEDVEVLDRGFLLSIRGGSVIKLLGTPGICMEEWLDAFSRVFARGGKEPEARATDWDEDMHWSSDGEGDPGDSQASYASTAASVPGARAQGAGRGQETVAPPATVTWSSAPHGSADGKAKGSAKAALAEALRRPASPRARQRAGSPRGQRAASPGAAAPQRQQSPGGRQLSPTQAPRPAPQEPQPRPGGHARQMPGPGFPARQEAAAHQPANAWLAAQREPGLEVRQGVAARAPPSPRGAERGRELGAAQPGALRQAGPQPGIARGSLVPEPVNQSRSPGPGLRPEPQGPQGSQPSPSAPQPGRAQQAQPGSAPGPGPRGASRSRSPSRARSPGRAPPPARPPLEPPAAARAAEAQDVDPKIFRDPPVHFGALGFEDGGMLVQRYAALFQDRLDSWALAVHAASGQPPRGRIAICDVRGIEMVRGGFVLNLKGRKVELFVESGDAISAWSKALHSVILTQYEPQRPPVRSASAKEFLPRVASLPPPAHQFTPGLQPWRNTAIFSRPLSREGVRVNTHKDGLQANLVLHGKDAVALAAGQREVAGKVNERVGPLQGQPEPAEKLTGRLRLAPRRAGEEAPPASKITGKRLLSPRREQPLSAKITGEARTASPERHCFTTPVTDTGREPSSRLRSLSPGLPPKICERSTSYGSPRSGTVSDLDKKRAFGVFSSHHSTGVSWSWAPN